MAIGCPPMVQIWNSWIEGFTELSGQGSEARGEHGLATLWSTSLVGENR